MATTLAIHSLFPLAKGRKFTNDVQSTRQRKISKKKSKRRKARFIIRKKKQNKSMAKIRFTWKIKCSNHDKCPFWKVQNSKKKNKIKNEEIGKPTKFQYIRK